MGWGAGAGGGGEVQASLQNTARTATRRIEDANAIIVSVLHTYLAQWPAEAADLEPQASFAGHWARYVWRTETILALASSMRRVAVRAVF